MLEPIAHGKEKRGVLLIAMLDRLTRQVTLYIKRVGRRVCLRPYARSQYTHYRRNGDPLASVSPDTVLETIDSAYRKKRPVYHPDKRGSSQELEKLQAAYHPVQAKRLVVVLWVVFCELLTNAHFPVN
ncbi:J domain-containing protein [Spirosoma koreense]